MGDGGGWGSSSGDSPLPVGEAGNGASLLRRLRLPRGLVLFPDLTDVASLFSAAASLLARMAELRGLSVLPLPGIFERRVLKERVDSFVSDLLKDGYDWRSLPPGPPFEEPPPSFEL